MSLVEPLLEGEVEVVAGVQIAQAPVVSGDRQTWLCVVVCKRKEEVVLSDRHWSGSLKALAETRVCGIFGTAVSIWQVRTEYCDALVRVVLIADA
jgi:hypothetical protein